MINYMEENLKELKEYASENNIPIMQDEGIKYLTNYIKQNNIKKVLEIGTAIGYSAIMMCLANEETSVVSIERDEKRYLEAIKNIKKFKLEDRIHLIFNDALEVKLNDKYDLIFIDAAKAQNRKFFEKFASNLIEHGTIITDNMNFHGLVFEKEEKIESRNLRQLVRKVKEYRTFLENNPNYNTEILNIGDGIAISIKTNN